MFLEILFDAMEKGEYKCWTSAETYTPEIYIDDLIDATVSSFPSSFLIVQVALSRQCETSEENLQLSWFESVSQELHPSC